MNIFLAIEHIQLNDGSDRVKLLKCYSMRFLELNEAIEHRQNECDAKRKAHIADSPLPPRRSIFDQADALRGGTTVALTLRSHAGRGIAKKYEGERRAGPWRYIESAAGDEKKVKLAHRSGHKTAIMRL